MSVIRQVNGESLCNGSEAVSEDAQDKRLVEDVSDDVEAHSATPEEVYPEPTTEEPDDSEPDFELHGSWGGIG